MKRLTWMIGLAGLLAILVSVALFLTWTAWRYRRTRIDAFVHRTMGGSQLRRQKPEIEDAKHIVEGDQGLKLLDKYAWKQFMEMIPPQRSNDLPEWEGSWKTKGDVGLDQSFLADSFADVSFSNSENELPELFRDSFRTAIQRKDKVHGVPNFASVLFNETAASSVEAAKKVLSSDSLQDQKPIPEFKPGSVIAKAIWTMIPVSNDPAISRLSITKISSRSEGYLTSEAGLSNTALVNAPPVAADAKTWIYTTLNVSASPISDKWDCSASGGSLPLSCFYGFVFKVDPESLQNRVRRKIIATVTSDADQRLAVNDSCPADRCAVLLMGIHFMIRPKKDDSIGRLNPNWVFMTFWWTGEPNRTGLPPPWKYFQMRATQDPSEGVCYNPYLEGVIPPAGAVTNCVNCHQYAAFNLKGGSKVGAGSNLGNGPSPGNLQLSTVSEYFADSVKTDRVWSMASLNDLKGIK